MSRTAVLMSIAMMSMSTTWAMGDELIISEVVDATLPGGLPKFVELTNCGGTTVDLSAYSIGNYNNGGTTLGGGASTVLSGTLLPGESYVISYESSDSPGVGTFFDTYGFDPDNFDLGAFINGDDVIALFLGPATGDGSDATLVDVYGVIGVDGSGEVWEHTDGYSFRNPLNGPNPVFAAGEWTIGGANSLEDPGGDDVVELGLILALTTPGTHDCGMPPSVPAVGTWGLLGMAAVLLFAVSRRRRAA